MRVNISTGWGDSEKRMGTLRVLFGVYPAYPSVCLSALRLALLVCNWIINCDLIG